MPSPRDQPVLYGLLLAGGRIRRMGMDKANLPYGRESEPQWKRMVRRMQPLCEELEGYEAGDGEFIEDGPVSLGPLTGLLAAHAQFPGKAWLVVACDLPLLDGTILENLLSHRGEAPAIAYTSANDGLPEPLCTVYEPAFFPVLEAAMQADIRCPRKILLRNPDKTRLLELPRKDALENANTPGEYERLQARLKGAMT